MHYWLINKMMMMIIGEVWVVITIIASVLVLLLLLLLLQQYYYILFVKVQQKSMIRNGGDGGGLPPGSMGWPLLGETIPFLKPHKSFSMGSFLQQRCSRYGRVFKSHLFGSPTIVSCDLELNLFILHNEDKLFQSYYPKPVRDILGKHCMMLVNGDTHKKLRNVALSFVSSVKSSPRYPHYVHNLSISVMKSWQQRREIYFCKEAKDFTMNIMMKSLLNMDTGEPRGTRILQDFLAFMKGLVSLPLYVPGSSYAKAIKAEARLVSTIREIIEEREKGGGGRVRGGGAKEEEDFLDEIMGMEEICMDEKVSVVLDILFAGYETTSGLLALLVYFLPHAPPSVLQQLKDEHTALRRSKKDGDEPLSWEDYYKKMTYTSHVISEAMRCGNLVKFVHRKALQEVIFKGYVIPAGWQVLPIFSATHLDPALHENPTNFDPSRWNNDQAEGMNSSSSRSKVTPFSGGTRLCPGAELAKVEAAIFLHHFLLNFRWKLKEGDDYPLSRPYLEFKRGLLVELERESLQHSIFMAEEEEKKKIV